MAAGYALYRADMEFLRHPIAALVVALAIGGIALSGKLSVPASQILFFCAWAISIWALPRQPKWRFWGASAAVTFVALLLFAWARPEAVPRDFGFLVPHRQLLFPNHGSGGTWPVIELGDSTCMLKYTGQPGTPLFDFFNNTDLTIEQIDRTVRVSTKVVNRDGNVVAELYRNEWKVAPPPLSWDRNYTDDALEVISQSGDVILQVRLLPDRVQLQGEWWHDHINGVRLAGSHRFPENCGIIVFGPIFKPEQTTPIERMFRYPSDMHFGELS
jgi:hypothetical protein